MPSLPNHTLLCVLVSLLGLLPLQDTKCLRQILSHYPESVEQTAAAGLTALHLTAATVRLLNSFTHVTTPHNSALTGIPHLSSVTIRGTLRATSVVSTMYQQCIPDSNAHRLSAPLFLIRVFWCWLRHCLRKVRHALLKMHMEQPLFTGRHYTTRYQPYTDSNRRL